MDGVEVSPGSQGVLIEGPPDAGSCARGGRGEHPVRDGASVRLARQPIAPRVEMPHEERLADARPTSRTTLREFPPPIAGAFDLGKSSAMRIAPATHADTG
jgi:hypothetical protein